MTDFETCDQHIIHEEAVLFTRKKMVSGKTMDRLADFYKVFSDPTRVKILYALLIKELCVCDIASVLQMSQSAISHQLRTLKSAHLVKSRRQGKVIYYSLDDDHITGVLEKGLEHIRHIE